MPESSAIPGRGEAAPPVTGSLVRLPELEPKVCAVIRRVEAEDDSMDRLKALGICIGRQVELVKRGDPLIVRVFGSRLGISARLADRVLVEPCAGRCECPDGSKATT
ncbi:MAG TPA: FeoA family protein [Verrucomicrobiae bacterium]|nr:FeoA family protein [Verrucomicrobiae bacterium]